MIYDCFTFYNELDLLEIRLNVLNGVVDKFVICEATKTHAGNDKELFFAKNKERFARFADKIIHIAVDDYGGLGCSWDYENHQRNALVRGLQNMRDNDLIVLSDLDEIPNPAVLKKEAGKSGHRLLLMNMYYYFLNYRNITEPDWSLGTRLFSWKDFCEDNTKLEYDFFYTQAANHGRNTMTKMRFVPPARIIKNGGWHFSYCGGLDFIVNKLKNFSHQEFNRSEYLDIKAIKEKIAKGQDILGRPYQYQAEPLDCRFPKYILENLDKYAGLVYQTGKREAVCFYCRAVRREILYFYRLMLRLAIKFICLFIPSSKLRKKLRCFYKH